MNGTDIVGLTFKLLNPGDVMRVLESERGKERERGGGSRGGDVGEGRRKKAARGSRWLCETVKQDDSAGLSFERLPACQFRCNVFIDTLLAAT